MNRPRKVKTNYANKRNEAVSLLAHKMVGSMSANTYFKDGAELAAPLQKSVTALDQFAEAHPNPNSLDTAEQDALRETVLADMSVLGVVINQRHTGNEAALLSTGYELASDPKPVPPPEAPKKCVIAKGPQSGSVTVRSKRPLRVTNMLWFYTTDATLPLDQWKWCLCNADELTITGLVRGQELFVRVAALNGASTRDNLAFVEAEPAFVN